MADLKKGFWINTKKCMVHGCYDKIFGDKCPICYGAVFKKGEIVRYTRPEGLIPESECPKCTPNNNKSCPKCSMYGIKGWRGKESVFD